MIDHVTLKVHHLEKSRIFYEKAFSPLGYTLSFGKEGLFYAFDLGQGMLFEIAQYDENTPLTSTHIAFRAESPEKVNAFYQSALSAGGVDNGKPGPRPHYTEHYYACFILDPDGHNIEAMFDHFSPYTTPA